MEKARKGLKFLSECILIFLTFSFIRTILEVFLVDIKVDNIPGNTMLIVKIVLCVIYAVIIFGPQLYVGVKGIKVANKPDDSKAHIVWAVIFVIFAVIAGISAISDMAGTGDIAGNVFRLIDAVIDIAFYFIYIKYAKKVLESV